MKKMRNNNVCRDCGMSDDLKNFSVYPLACSDSVYNTNNVHQDADKPFDFQSTAYKKRNKQRMGEKVFKTIHIKI